MFCFFISIFCSTDINFIFKLDKNDTSIYKIQFQLLKAEELQEPKLGWTYELKSCKTRNCIIKQSCNIAQSDETVNYTIQNHQLKKSIIDSENILFMVLYNNNASLYYYTFIDLSEIKKPGWKTFRMYKMDDQEFNTYKREGILDYDECKKHKNFISNVKIRFYDSDDPMSYIIIIVVLLICTCSFVIGYMLFKRFMK